MSTPAASFDAAVGFLLNATANYAATKSPTRFATGVLLQHDGGQQSPMIFGLVRCTPDLPPADCQACLSYVLDYGVNKFCSGAPSCMVTLVRCGFVYDQSRFFSGSPLVQLPAASSSRQHTASKTHRVLAITLPIIGAAVMAIGLLYCLLCRGRKRQTAQPPQGGTVMPGLFDPEDKKVVESFYIDLQTLRDATREFDLDNKLGEGGFGSVYKVYLFNLATVWVSSQWLCLDVMLLWTCL